MRSVALHCHPSTPCPAVEGIVVSVAQAPGDALVLLYEISGDLGRLRLPAPGAGARADGLWQHTCFEAFVRTAGQAYCEFNFSPGGAWAAYAFDSYRTGMTALQLLEAPELRPRHAPGKLCLEADVPLAGLPVMHAPGPLRLALSAVIEDDAGQLSYWALVHPAGKPDFHDRDSFALELERPDR
jgi:hypothetical protein